MSDSAAFELIAGRYRLDQRIGSGGFGEVWRATDTLLNRPVAVKIMRTELLGQELARRRFEAEARHAGSLVHVAIAKIYDYDTAGPGGRPFLVMEFVPGHSLAEELATGPVGPARAMDLVAQIAAGLQAAHSAGLAHGDIKPHNVLLDFDGRVKLTDFGVPLTPDAEAAAPGALLGTPEYQAPERMTGGRGSAASDLYSLGILAFQCLTGRVPFRGRAVEVAEAHRNWPLPPLPAGLPAEVARLVTDLTAKDPADRPGSAEDAARRAAGLRDELALQTPAGVAAGPGGADGGPAAADGRGGPDQGTLAGRGSARPPHRRWYLGLAAIVVAAAVAWAAVTLLAPAGGGPASQRPGAHLVDVNATALRGQPVATAADRLRDQGLTVTIQWRPDSGVPAGLVIAVSPAGWLPAGTRVLLTGSAPPGTTGKPGPVKSGPPRSGSPPGRRPPPPRPRPTSSGGPPILTGSPQPTIPLPSASSATPSASATPSPTATPTPTPDPSSSGTGGVGGARAGTTTAGAAATGAGPATAGTRTPDPILCGIPGPEWVGESLAVKPLPAALPAGSGCLLLPAGRRS
jgi:eukaryotic-like serine/threonine-protein kinase